MGCLRHGSAVASILSNLKYASSSPTQPWMKLPCFPSQFIISIDVQLQVVSTYRFYSLIVTHLICMTMHQGEGDPFAPDFSVLGRTFLFGGEV